MEKKSKPSSSSFKKPMTMAEIFFGLSIGIGAVWFMASSNPDTSRLDEDAACKKDLECWANKHIIAAGVRCESEIETLAKNSARWTDGFSRFDSFRWKDVGTIITYSGNKVEFQNGFGTYKRQRYECDYAPLAKLVINVRVL
jgi:hypothetical protein